MTFRILIVTVHVVIVIVIIIQQHINHIGTDLGPDRFNVFLLVRGCPIKGMVLDAIALPDFHFITVAIIIIIIIIIAVA